MMLCRGVARIIAKKGADDEEVVTEVLATAIVGRPGPETVVLELTVTGQGLVGARWGGQELPALTRAEVNGRFQEQDYLGSLGVMNRGGEARFHGFRCRASNPADE